MADLSRFTAQEVAIGRQLLAKNAPLMGIPQQVVANATRAARVLASGRAGGLGVRVELDTRRLEALIRNVPKEIANKAIYRAINNCIDLAYTQTAKDLQAWTGIKIQRRIKGAMSKKRAYQGSLSGALVIKDGYLKLTKRYFGAQWKQGWPFATSQAWEGGKRHPHAFFAGDKAPLFHRVSAARYPIKPVFGPNPAREAERHIKLLNYKLQRIADVRLVPEVARLLERAFKDAAAS